MKKHLHRLTGCETKFLQFNLTEFIKKLDQNKLKEVFLPRFRPYTSYDQKLIKVLFV